MALAMTTVIPLALNLFISPQQAAVLPGKVTNGTLTLGYLISWSHEWAVGPYIGSAIGVGIAEIERRQLLPDYEIDWILADTWCEVRAIYLSFFIFCYHLIYVCN